MRHKTPVSDRNRQRFERGQSLVEFAFSLVVLLLLVAGAVDAGRALFTYLSMRDAAQEGAVYASLHPTDITGINQRTRQSSNLMYGLGNAIVITITPTVPGKDCSGTTGGVDNGILITIHYENFPLTMPFIGMFVGNGDQTIPITVRVTNSIISPPCK